MTQRGLVAVAVLLGVTVLQASAQSQSLSVGNIAPNLTVKEFIKGEPVTTFKKGKVYVIEFWATWCGPCKGSIPHLTELQKKYKDIVFIGVNIWEKDLKAVKPFVKEMGDKMDYRVAMDGAPEDKKSGTGAMAQSWMAAAGQEYIPCVFIINRDRKIAWIGGSGDMDGPLEKIHAGKWDLQAAIAAFATAKKEKAQRAAEAAKAKKEKTQRLIAQLSESEKAAAMAVDKWGGTLNPDEGGKSVTSVDLHGKHVTDVNLKLLKSLKGLQHLVLVDTDVTDAGLRELKSLKELRDLFLGGTKVTDIGLKELKGLEGLQRLGLARTQVTDAGLKQLKDLRNLRTLNLSETKVTKVGRSDLQKALPDLKIEP